MENNSIQKLILGFLVLIVGISLIGSVATNTNAVTVFTGVASESLDIAGSRLGTGACPMSINNTYPLYVANLPTGWKASGECPVTSFSMVNQTSVAATVTTDYIFYGDNGSLYLENTTRWVGDDCAASANTTTLTYNYCSDDYVNLPWGRQILDLISGFFALALLGAGVGLFYSVAKDAGLIGK